MQELIENYEMSANQYLEMKQTNKAALYFNLAKWTKEKYLEKEKEQIINAFEYGQINVNEDGCLTEENGAEEYYNQTYNQNK